MRKYLPYLILIQFSGCTFLKIDVPESMSLEETTQILEIIADEKHNCDFGRINKIEYCPNESEFKMSRECYRAIYASGYAIDVYKIKEKYEVSLPIVGVEGSETIYQVSGCPY